MSWVWISLGIIVALTLFDTDIKGGLIFLVELGLFIILVAFFLTRHPGIVSLLS